MARFMALPRGTRLVLVSAPLLLVSLFFTWQDLPVDYGPAGVAIRHVDGFDGWGLLLAILVVLAITVVVVVNTSEEDLRGSRSHAAAELGLGVSIAAVAVLKSVTDAGSTIESYVFVGLALAVAAGTALDWAEARRGTVPAVARPGRGISSTA